MHFAVTLCVVIIVFVQIYEVESKQCKIPNTYDAGECLDISKCKPIWDLYKKKHKTEVENLFIRQVYCGNPSSSKIKMCCPPMSTWNNFELNPVIYGSPTITLITQPNNNIINESLGSVFIPPVKETPSTTKPNVVPAVPLPLSNVNAVADCGRHASSSNKITGGEPTSIDQYPWLVLFEYSSGSLNCGGSLITSRFVLTAAHCFAGTIGSPTIARLAEYNFTSYPTDTVETEGGGEDSINNIFVPVESVIKHPDFSRVSHHHDIGLVKLAESVAFTDFIKIICLPTKDYVPEFTVGTNFTVAGWGDDPKTNEFYDVKKEVIVPYVPLNTCGTIHRRITLIENQMCAGGEDGKDTCKGDSGGPLMYESDQVFVIVGVVSFGPRDCGTKGQPAIYTHVFKYLDWINSVIQGK